MNVIVTNKQKNIIDNANIDVYKELNGFFKVDDLINYFKNYFFTKMIIDATSIVEFANPAVLKKLAEGIGSEKLILLLPQKPEPPRKFLEILINLGIYNFSSDINDVVNFLQKPNTYENVKIYLNNDIVNDNFYINNDNNFNKIELDNINNNQFSENTGNYSDLSLNDDYEEQDLSLNNNVNGFVNNYLHSNNRYVLGIKNVTSHAGTTTLIYMLKNTLEHQLNKRVLAVEVNTNDFVYFRSRDMISVSEEKLENTVKNNDYDIVLIDLNHANNVSVCNDVIYLIEPSIISVNRLILENKMVFASLKDKKVILNKSVISNNDVNKFSQESGVSFYFVIPPLNDRVENSIIENLINKLEIKH